MHRMYDKAWVVCMASPWAVYLMPPLVAALWVPKGSAAHDPDVGRSWLQLVWGRCTFLDAQKAIPTALWMRRAHVTRVSTHVTFLYSPPVLPALSLSVSPYQGLMCWKQCDSVRALSCVALWCGVSALCTLRSAGVTKSGTRLYMICMMLRATGSCLEVVVYWMMFALRHFNFNSFYWMLVDFNVTSFSFCKRNISVHLYRLGLGLGLLDSSLSFVRFQRKRSYGVGGDRFGQSIILITPRRNYHSP